MITDDLMTVRQAARASRRTTETVRRWIWEGKLPAQKLGNQLFIRRADLARLSAPDGRQDIATRLAALAALREVRERIRERLGGDFDILEALDRSREAHP